MWEVSEEGEHYGKMKEKQNKITSMNYFDVPTQYLKNVLIKMCCRFLNPKLWHGYYDVFFS